MRDAERIGPCLVQKSGSLSRPCQMEDFAEAIRRDSAKWLDVIRRSGIKLD